MAQDLSMKLFEILYKFNSTANYRVISFNDVASEWKEKTQFAQFVDELIDNEFISCKYRDSENICYTCLKKPVSLPVMAKLGIKTASVKNTKIRKNLFIQGLVGFISSFLGALIALLIIR